MRGTVSRTVVSVALVVVAIAFGLDAFSDTEPSTGLRVGLQIGVVVAALVIAGIAYQAWSVTKPVAPRLTGAMVTSLIGGASLASTVTSATDGQLFGSSQLAALGVVALTFAVVLLGAEARDADR